jgi:hypothetical protein
LGKYYVALAVAILVFRIKHGQANLGWKSSQYHERQTRSKSAIRSQAEAVPRVPFGNKKKEKKGKERGLKRNARLEWLLLLEAWAKLSPALAQIHVAFNHS